MTEFISIPLPIALLILIILALSFAWSFRLAIKLDRTIQDLLIAEQRELDAEYEMIEYLEYNGNAKQYEDAQHQKKYLDEKQMNLNQRKVR